MIWYPYVQMKKMKTPYKIVDAEGVYLYTQDNKMIILIISGLHTHKCISMIRAGKRKEFFSSAATINIKLQCHFQGNLYSNRTRI